MYTQSTTTAYCPNQELERLVNQTRSYSDADLVAAQASWKAKMAEEQRLEQERVDKAVAILSRNENRWKSQQKARMLLFTVFLGALCICMILLRAYMADAQYNINKIENRCVTLEGEIADLNAKLQGKSSIVVIEEKAKDLGMVYPEKEQMVFLTAEDETTDNSDVSMADRLRLADREYLASREGFQ